MRHLTDKDFNTIKVLINAGVKTSKIQEVTGRSSSTISAISRSDTLEDYKKLLREQRNHEETVIATDAPLTTAGLKELLTILNNRLQAIERKLGI